MADDKLDKVIKGLTQCTSFGEIGLTEDECNDCPYCEGYKTGLCWVQMNRDALELLKEQEMVEPKKTAYQRVDHTIAYRYRCGTCDMSIFPSYKYCPFCGQAVKWE